MSKRKPKEQNNEQKSETLNIQSDKEAELDL